MKAAAAWTRLNESVKARWDYVSLLKEARLSPLSGMILAALLAIAGLTALFALYAIVGPVSSSSLARRPDWSPPTLAGEELEPPKPASADVETLSRPIFSKSRRPSPKHAAPQATSGNAAAAPDGLAVTAIVRSKGITRALVLSMDAPGGLWQKVGDTVGGWLITAIEPTELILSSGPQVVRVKLYSDDTSAPTTGAEAPPPGAPPPPPMGGPTPPAPANGGPPPPPMTGAAPMQRP